MFGVVGAVVGGLFVWVLAVNAVNTNQRSMMQMMGMQTDHTMMMQAKKDEKDDENNNMMSKKNMMMNHSMDTTMQMMSDSLKGKTGDAFDKAFLSEMIVHHQGAIAMAEMALQNSNHEEIKNLAHDIITAQTEEIAQMKKWQEAWGYTK
jgi:uncharacterized protein (DUF305 family)